MSRAGNILEWVYLVDEADTPTAFTTDRQDSHGLSMAKGYTYQNRGQKDRQGDSEKSDGTKPSGMVSNVPAHKGRTNIKMSSQDQEMMDTQ
jgi:hypothetical protein